MIGDAYRSFIFRAGRSRAGSRARFRKSRGQSRAVQGLASPSTSLMAPCGTCQLQLVVSAAGRVAHPRGASPHTSCAHRGKAGSAAGTTVRAISKAARTACIFTTFMSRARYPSRCGKCRSSARPTRRLSVARHALRHALPSRACEARRVRSNVFLSRRAMRHSDHRYDSRLQKYFILRSRVIHGLHAS